uniref:Ig-like domain-containing protein n=1 Tax=Ficedula albicollis TaxID=59894 RepID=A0A803V918_FICAL
MYIYNFLIIGFISKSLKTLGLFLLCWITLLCFFSFIATGSSAQDLQQTTISITKPEGKNVQINCHVSSPDFINTLIHWYQKKGNEAPKRVAYISSTFFLENRNDEGKFSVAKDLSKSVCILTVSKITPQDSATYYCAIWDAHSYYHKVFGSGTKLVVSGKLCVVCVFSPPANSEILQKKLENQTTYVCLIEKFYPEVIRVTWTDDEKEVTDNVVKGDAWQSAKGDDDYSIASWLTVPAENKDKKYYCKYEHEEQQASLSTQGMFHLLKMDFDLLL